MAKRGSRYRLQQPTTTTSPSHLKRRKTNTSLDNILPSPHVSTGPSGEPFGVSSLPTESHHPSSKAKPTNRLAAEETLYVSHQHNHQINMLDATMVISHMHALTGRSPLVCRDKSSFPSISNHPSDTTSPPILPTRSLRPRKRKGSTASVTGTSNADHPRHPFLRQTATHKRLKSSEETSKLEPSLTSADSSYNNPEMSQPYVCTRQVLGKPIN